MTLAERAASSPRQASARRGGAEAKTARLKEKIEGLRRQMQSLKEMGKQVEAASDKQVSPTDPPMIAVMRM